MLTTAAALRGATKHYKTFALGPVDLAVPAGSILGLIGENGAGKTTALKLLCGAIRPAGGSVELLGGSPADPAIRARIGVVFEDAYFPDCFNAACVGKSMAGIFGKRWDTAKFDALVRRFELDGSKKIKEYSRGMRMKLSLATALAHDPELLILDEATAGLDPVVRGELLDLLLDFIQDEQHSVLMSSHITSDLEQVADAIACITASCCSAKIRTICCRNTACCAAPRPTLPACPRAVPSTPDAGRSAAKRWSRTAPPPIPPCPMPSATVPASMTSCAFIAGGMHNERTFV